MKTDGEFLQELIQEEIDTGRKYIKLCNKLLAESEKREIKKGSTVESKGPMNVFIY